MREHTEIIRPPRALWVTFELGRPFGAPDDPELQRRVASAALALLEAPSGPVLADYPERVAEPDLTGWACPVRFGAAEAPLDRATGALEDEIAALAPWYDRGVARAGRTMVGVAGMSVIEAARFLASHLDGAEPLPVPAGLDRADAIKRACEDLKAYYIEAVQAQPGGAASAHQLAEWLWGETVLGRLLLDLYPVLVASQDAAVQWVGIRLLVPATELHRLSCPIHPRSR